MTEKPNLEQNVPNRIQNAKTSITTFVKKHKTAILATAGIAALAGVSAVARSLNDNIEEIEDWETQAIGAIEDGSYDFIIGFDAKTQKAEAYASDEVAELLIEREKLTFHMTPEDQ